MNSLPQLNNSKLMPFVQLTEKTATAIKPITVNSDLIMYMQKNYKGNTDVTMRGAAIEVQEDQAEIARLHCEALCDQQQQVTGSAELNLLPSAFTSNQPERELTDEEVLKLFTKTFLGPDCLSEDEDRNAWIKIRVKNIQDALSDYDKSGEKKYKILNTSYGTRNEIVTFKDLFKRSESLEGLTNRNITELGDGVFDYWGNSIATRI